MLYTNEVRQALCAKACRGLTDEQLCALIAGDDYVRDHGQDLRQILIVLQEILASARAGEVDTEILKFTLSELVARFEEMCSPRYNDTTSDAGLAAAVMGSI